MPRAGHADVCSASTEAMLAEHERLSDLYLYNTEMGEKRTTLYLTVVSAASALLLGMAQFKVDNTFLLGSAAGMLLVVLLIGMLTFYRLIERRVRGMEYLRAINRIHHYFVDQDPGLELYYYWPPCDDTPFHSDKDAATTGLRDLISVLNSLFLGALVGLLGYVLLPAWNVLWLAIVGLSVTVLAWVGHERYERRRLAAEENKSRAFVRFPARAGE